MSEPRTYWATKPTTDLAPEIERLIELRQSLVGRGGRWRLVWPDVNLRDAVETARAEAYVQQERQLRLENGRVMWELGYWSQAQAAQDADPELVLPFRPLDLPPAPAAADNAHTLTSLQP